MTGLYLPGATFRPISYRAAAGKFTHPPLGYIVHVPVSNGSLFDYFNGLRSPGRKFCTAWIPKAGHGTPEQYTTLDMKAWAQGNGNDDYWSFEVEGFPGEPMDDFQLDTLATWHRFLGVKDAIATAPGQQGVGTHQMGGAAWGGHSCPGTIRTAQLPQILTRAAQGADMPLTEDDARLVLTGAAVLKNTLAPNPDTAPRVAASYLIEQTAARVAQIAAKSSPTAPTLTDADINAIAAKTADLLAARLKS